MIRAPSSLRARLLLGTAALIVVALAAAALGMGFALHRFIQAQVDGRLDGQILAVADALRAEPDGRLRLEREVDGPPFDRPHSGWYWEVLAPAPVLRSRSLAGEDFAIRDILPTPAPPHHPGPPPGAEPPDGPGAPLPFPALPQTAIGAGPRDRSLRVRMRQVPVGPAIVTVAVAAPREALDGPFRDAMIPVAVTLGFIGVLMVGGGLAQVWLGLRPLQRLRAELTAVREGHSERLAGSQPAEVQPLVVELNALLDQHAANLERARRHVANLAHGLKTPLATLAVSLDEPGRDPDRRLAALVAAMDRMIRHHLARARVAALGGPTRARVPLEPRIADHVVAFGRIYADKNMTFERTIPADLEVACEAQDLDEVLGNLIDNACRWAKGRVAIAAAAAGQRVTLTIEDDGPGLPAAQCEAALRAGQRLDETVPGYGFGLPIARELTELYGGTVSLARAALGGLKVVLELPRAA